LTVDILRAIHIPFFASLACTDRRRAGGW